MKICISYKNKDLEIYNQIKKDLLVFSEQQFNQEHTWFDYAKD